MRAGALGHPITRKGGTRWGPRSSLKMTTKKSESVLNDFFVAEGTAAAAFLHGLLTIRALDVINFRATEDAGEDHHDDEYCYQSDADGKRRKLRHASGSAILSRNFSLGF